MDLIKEDNTSEVAQPRRWLGMRHLQLVMIFLGTFVIHCTRTTMSIGIVDMTDSTKENYFDWTIQMQGVILSSFTWGYVIPQILAGELVGKFGGKNFLLMCVGVNSVFSLILPLAATYGGWVAVCICRGIQGLGQGPMFPTMLYLLGKWVPVNERAQLSGLVFSGSYLGIATQMIVSGYIADYWGWAMIFYVNGVAGVIWTAVYLCIGSDTPQVSKLISTEERHYIQSSLGQIGGHEKLKTPWKSILTSLPFYTIVIASVGYSWGYWTLLTEIPTYFSKVLQVDIKSNGVMSALPYLIMFALNFPVGYASDYIIRKKWVGRTACRKIFNSFGFFGAALSLYCLTLIPAGNSALAAAILCVALAFNSGFYGGFILVYLDIAQNFSSVMMGISNFTANFVGLFAPLLVGLVVKDEYNPKQWVIVFYVSAMTYVVTNIIFLLFATSEEQKWNKGTETSKKTIKDKVIVTCYHFNVKRYIFYFVEY